MTLASCRGHAEAMPEFEGAPCSGLPANVPPARTGGDTFCSDPALAEAVWREAGAWAMDGCRELGELCARPDTIELGFAANEHPPVLEAYDRSGRRVDQPRFHPSWHSLLDMAAWHGRWAGRGWRARPAPTPPGRPGSSSWPRSRRG